MKVFKSILLTMFVLGVIGLLMMVGGVAFLFG